MRHVALSILAVAFVAVAGCASPLTPETKAAIAQVKNEAAVETAKAKAAADAAQAKADAATKAAEEAAKAKPALHPVEFANLIVQDIRGPLVTIGLIFTVLTFVGLGAMWAAKSVPLLGGLIGSIIKIATPILFTTAAGCWLSLWAAPLAFWFISGSVVAAVVIFVIQLAKAHWNIAELLKGAGPLIVVNK